MVTRQELEKWFPDAPAHQINKLVVPKAVDAERLPFNRHRGYPPLQEQMANYVTGGPLPRLAGIAYSPALQPRPVVVPTSTQHLGHRHYLRGHLPQRHPRCPHKWRSQCRAHLQPLKKLHYHREEMEVKMLRYQKVKETKRKMKGKKTQRTDHTPEASWTSKPNCK